MVFPTLSIVSAPADDASIAAPAWLTVANVLLLTLRVTGRRWEVATPTADLEPRMFVPLVRLTVSELTSLPRVLISKAAVFAVVLLSITAPVAVTTAAVPGLT
ncbi:MAG: hypothetical protein DCF29_10295 [Alphaproteobacteria bacterium]|nr:MAG: hypothetical protein DCF29_10295 [Alphaproteobacteria bacterium]